MTILSFYIQHNDCFVSLKHKGKTIEGQFTLRQTETQAMTLISFVQETWAKIGSPEISCLMAPRGPGSFTSLRVGLAAAQGLELAFPNAKIFAPTHFDVLAYAARLQGIESFIVLIDSKKGDFYGQLFYHGSFEKPKVYTNEAVKTLIEKNPEIQTIMDLDPPPGNQNLATCQIELYEKEPELRENSDYQKFQPVYLYLPDYVKRTRL